jgi:hypothetical protein
MALAMITKGTVQFITLRQQTPSVDTHCLCQSDENSVTVTYLTISGQHHKTLVSAALTRDLLNTNQYAT